MNSMTFLTIAIAAGWTTGVFAQTEYEVTAEVFKSEALVLNGAAAVDPDMIESVSAEITRCADNYCIGLSDYQCQDALNRACKNKKRAGLFICGEGSDSYGRWYIGMTCPTNPAVSSSRAVVE